MSIAELRMQLHQAIDSVSDKEQLDSVYAILKGGPSAERMTQKEYTQEIDQAISQIKKDQFLSHKDLERESENW